jgi:2'-5' RNA ligase
MRAFIAVDLPPEIQIALGQVQAVFREQLRLSAAPDDCLRWSRPEGIHLTLKFLGDVSQQQSNQIIERLQSLRSFQSFTIEVKGYGFFPDRRRPQVLWAGVTAPPALAELASGISRAMATLGSAPDRRAFAPHLTLARFKTPRRLPVLEAALSQQGIQVLGQFDVSEFFLFESQLSFGSPAQYRKVARFPQRGPVLGVRL